MSVDSSSFSVYNKILSQSSECEGSGERHKNKRVRRFLHGEKEQEEKESYKNEICMYNADIMQEIFLRLPLKSLHRCKLLSKISHNLISATCFRSNYLLTKRITSSTPLMLGFFYQPMRLVGDVTHPAIRFVPCSNQGKKLMVEEGVPEPPFDDSLSFLLKDDTSIFYDKDFGPMPTVVFIVASSNGFLLCRKERRYFAEYDRYYICNPITKQWVSLPKPPNFEWSCFVEGLIVQGNSTSMYPCLEWVTYKVVRASLPSDRMLFHQLPVSVEIFSSETQEWKEFCLEIGSSSPVVKLKPRLELSVISRKGTVCSLAQVKETSSQCAVAFNLNLHKNQQLQIIRVPDRNEYYKFSRLFESEGLIHFMVEEVLLMMIYELNEDDMNWFLKYELFLGNNIHEDILYRKYNIEAIHPLNSALVLLNLGNQNKVLLDLNNANMEPELLSEFATDDLCTHIFYPYQWPCWPPVV